MKYSLVKQFALRAVDNIFSFFYKIVDFGKILLDVFMAFLEIWEKFYLIFYNFFMYIYYLGLYFIDKGTEEGSSAFYGRRYGKGAHSHAPKIHISSDPNPIPAEYMVSEKKEVKIEKPVSAPLSAKTYDNGPSMTSPRQQRSSAGKFSVLRALMEFIFKIKDFILLIICAPFKMFLSLFDTRPEKSAGRGLSRGTKSSAYPKRGSLIDEYMKEYENRHGSK